MSNSNGAPVADSEEVLNAESSNIYFDYALLEATFKKSLSAFFSTITPNTTLAEFWAVYQKEAEAFDKDYSKKYDQDLDTTLIFAGLFSAVTSAFIIDVQGDLKPDYAENTAALILILIQEVKNPSGAGVTSEIPSIPEFTPDPVIVTVQAILYASLASSLFAAFFAVLGKQWVNRYMNRKGGSQTERNHDRQVKLDGMERWSFRIVMEALPLMLQAALLLFGCALTRYLWTINTIVAAVNLIITILDTLGYILLFVFATLSYACPYQTPLSICARWVLDFDRKHSAYVSHFMESVSSAWSWLAFGLKTAYRWIPPLPKNFFHKEVILPTDSSNGPSEKQMPVMNPSVHPLLYPANLKPQITLDTMNAACISWIVKHSTDDSVIDLAVRCVSDIGWHPCIEIAPPPTLHAFNAVTRCFPQIHPPVPGPDIPPRRLVPGLRNSALMALKALIHCDLQQKIQAYITKSELIIPWWISKMLCDEDDYELRGVIEIYNYSCAGFHFGQECFDLDKISHSHLIWISHTLVQHMWYEFAKSGYGAITDPSVGFFPLVRRCLSHPARLPNSVVTNLVTAVGLTVGIPLQVDYLSVRDKSPSLNAIIARICARLCHTVQAGNFTYHVYPTDKSFDALKRV